ncbi:tetratricopeptide repeat protein [Arthrobacter sp. Z1-15]
MVALPAGDTQRGLELLTWLFGIGYDPARDDFVQEYLPDASFTLPIADDITVQLPTDRNLIGLLLAELYQETGSIPAAVDVVEQLEPSTVTAVSLAELYMQQGRWNDVVDLAEGLINEDEAATFLLTQRGIAFREQGYFEAAHAALKEALRIRSRPADLHHRTLIERGLTYLREGKRSMARKDLEKVLAENSAYPGLREHLANLHERPGRDPLVALLEFSSPAQSDSSIVAIQGFRKLSGLHKALSQQPLSQRLWQLQLAHERLLVQRSLTWH